MTLQDYLKSQRGANGESLHVYICYPSTSGPNGAAAVGDPVKIRIWQPFSLMAIVPGPKITLAASATMRLEQIPGRFAADTGAPSC
jgi:hypothetical protein